MLTTDTCGFLTELGKVHHLPAQIMEGHPLTNAQEQTLASLSYPYFADVCHGLQAEISARLESAATKKGYIICDVPDVPSDSIFSRSLKSAHLRDIVRKQYSADFFNKPQKNPHGSFEVVCSGS